MSSTEKINKGLVARLRGGVYGINRIPLCLEAAAAIDELQAAHDAQAAEIERLQQALGECEGALATHRHPLEDAEHASFYRWLRDNYAHGDGYADIDKILNDGDGNNSDNASLDTAIRAAMKGGE